ncbi:MAG: cation:proton antiporter [Chloroflexota bacterium]|nr:cation:proton antiporter [Chloroflexota bacterium]
MELIGSDGLLAVLVAEIAFAWARTGEEKGEQLERQQRHYQETIKQVLQVPVFVLLGLALPWDEWAELGWAGAGLVVTVLLLRRIPALLLLKPLIPQIYRWDAALFVGWFGPIGVGALYLATVAHKETELEQVWPVVTLLVAVTIVAHDLTATRLSWWLAGRLRDDA